MPAEQDVAVAERRGIILTVDVPVCRVYQPLPVENYGIVREQRKRQNHLVYLGVAVAADAENLVLQLGELRDDLLRRVAVGQVVARSVIEQVAEQDQSVGTLRAVSL